MSQITLELLLEKIVNLTDKMETGFTGTHRRLDESNHRMAKQEARSDRHKKFITDLEKQDIDINGKIKTTRLFWVAMTAVLSALFGLSGYVAGMVL